MTELHQRGKRARRRIPYDPPLPCNHVWGDWLTAARFLTDPRFRGMGKLRQCAKCEMVEGVFK